MPSFTTKTLFMIPLTFFLLGGGAYSYYRRVTYYPYELIQTSNYREVERSALCCGQGTLDLCFSKYAEITDLKLDRGGTVYIDFSTGPPMEVVVPVNEF